MSDIKGSIMKITSTIAKTSSDVLKTTKLSINLSSEEERLKNIYIEIGKRVAQIYQYGGSLGRGFDEDFAQITKQEEKIKKIREQIEKIKGIKICPKCSAHMDKSAEFCSKCGYRAEEANPEHARTSGGENVPDAAPGDAPNGSAGEGRYCRACGRDNQEGDKFCLFCGRML